MKHITLALAILLLAQCQSKTDLSTGSIPGFDFVPHPVAVPEQPVQTLTIGSKAPDFRLPGTDGQYHALSDYDDASALVVIFTCNHCPTAQAYEDRIIDIDKSYKDRGVQVIAISPNSPLGLLHEELGYSDLGDTFEDMIVRDQDRDFAFPYLYDGDDQKVSLAYGPAATPQCFVFDGDQNLRYVGRLDGSEKPGTANAEDLRAAIDAILGGAAVANPITKTFGCSTKWGWKTKLRKKIDAEWAAKEVTLEEKSIEDLKDLIANETDKLRLINVWATWCGPCRLEYPEFVVIQRMFGARDFEFVSISADKLDKSALTNYISTNDDKYALIEAIDQEWNGALPYTALIEPGGKIVWSHQGEVDFHDLKRQIVDHPMIGRVY